MAEQIIPEAAPQEAPKPDKKAILGEAYSRGILPDNQKALYEEAVRRGLIPPPAKVPSPAERRVGPEVTSDILKQAIADPVGGAGQLVRGAVINAQKRKDQALTAVKLLRGMDPEVDYDTGLPFAVKVDVKNSDNPAEARLALEQKYGKGNVGQDKGGRWWVKQGGKKVAVFNEGVIGSISEGLAGVQATMPETTGAITGGIAGAAGGPPGVIAGAGVGAAAGKALSETGKAVRGTLSKSPTEELGALGTAAVINAPAEAAGQAVKAGGRGILSLLRNRYWEVTPESRAMTENLIRRGAIPPLVTVAPGAKSAQYDQMLRNMVKGDPQKERNVQFAFQRVMEMLKLADVPDSDIEEVFSSIVDPRRALSLRGEGETIIKGVEAHISGLEKEASASLQTAKSIADEQAKVLSEITQKSPPENVHKLFVEQAQLSRRRFGAAMSRVYDDIETMTGGKVIVPTAGMKKQAQDIISVLPSSNTPTIFHEIAGLPNKLTIKEAQRYRTRLFEAADSGNLTPGTIEHDYNEMARSVDSAMDPATFPDQKSMPAQAFRALESADTAYKEGIAKYRDARLNQMIRDFRNQKVLDPEKFASALFDTRSTFRVNSYRQIVGEDAWKTVQAADTKNLIRTAQRLATDASSMTKIDGQALLTTLDARGPMLDAIYGKETANLWRQYAGRLAALDGKIDVKALPTDHFTEALARSVSAKEQLQDFVNNDVLRALRRGGPEEIDAAVNVVVNPGQEAQLEHVIRFFGEGSQQVSAIRSAAIKKALSTAITTDTTGLHTRIGGENIDAFLKRYTRAEQSMLFPNGLDRDLRILADEMKALFPPSYQDMGGSLAAASIKGKVPFSPSADLKWLHVAFKGWLADREYIIRTIAGINEPATVAKKMRQAALFVIWRQFLNEQGQSLGSTAQTPEILQ